MVPCYPLEFVPRTRMALVPSTSCRNFPDTFPALVWLLGLARVSYVGNPFEPVLRRLQINVTAQRISHILTSVSWDCKLTQWLHGILNDNLSWEYLAAYMDVLQVSC